MVYLVLAVFIGSLLTVLFIFVRRSRRHATTKPLEMETVLKVAGVVTATSSILIGLIEFTDTQRERTSNEVREEYIRATQLLTEPESSRNMAGIMAMSQLAENSTERTWEMTESLSALIRHTVPRPPTSQVPELLEETGPFTYPPCNPRIKQKNGESPCTLLDRRNPLVQMALDALAYRNRQNETLANAPPRMRPQVEAAGRSLYRPLNDRESGKEHDWVRAYINRELLRRYRDDNDDRKLILEIQYPKFQAFPAIMRRPWLNLAHTDLTGAELRSPFFEGGDFHDADISLSNLPFASLARANLEESQIHKTGLYSSDLRGASLEHADVQATDLGGSDLRDAWMSGGTFTWSNFWLANLTGAYLVAAHMTKLETMAGARLDNAIAFRTDFSDAQIAGDTGESVCMQHAFLKQAIMERTDLRGVDLRHSEFQDADLRGARLRGADLRSTVLDGARIDGADLSNADLRGVDLTKTAGMPLRVTGAIVNEQTRLSSWPETLVKQVILRPEPYTDEPCAIRERTDAERNVLKDGQQPNGQ